MLSTLIDQLIFSLVLANNHPKIKILSIFSWSSNILNEYILSVSCCFIKVKASNLPQVALVRWTESVGLTLVNRDLTSLQLKTPSGQILSFYILQIFPFTSESKRMGIIVRVCIILLCGWVWILLVVWSESCLFLLFLHIMKANF